ncbi:MAG: aminoglycoside 3'-phosphotransferase [Microbacterium sp.]
MSIPTESAAVPPRMRELAAGAGLTAVWENGIGGLTFHTDDGRFIKWGPVHAETSMRAEAERMAWAGRFHPVPRVLAQGEADGEEWLVTAAVSGLSAVAPRWVADPLTAVRAVGAGLRALHDALPVAECPWSWSVTDRIANAAARGIDVPRELRQGPSVDLLVVCHGDACCPNTLVDDDGRWTAHVDLGALGVADRWADIAVACMSTEWNYGPGWEDALLDAYGLPRDPERMAYYQQLWNAT